MELSDEQWELLFKLAEEVETLRESYSLSYNAFLNFFSEKSILSKQDIIIGANFSYGWMPTILNIYSINLEEQLLILNNLKCQGEIPNAEQLEVLKSTFNNSIVGTSKLMHFIAPNLIPIWDSKVHNNLKKIVKLNSQVNTVKNFVLYYDFCNSVISDKRFIKLKKQLLPVFQLGNSDMRVIEQLLFLSRKNI